MITSNALKRLQPSSDRLMEEQDEVASLGQLSVGMPDIPGGGAAAGEHSVGSDALTQDSILRHHAECKMENKLRLKQVKNLEELIHFKIKTVSDKLVEDGTLIHPVSQTAGLYALRKVVDPLLTTDAYPAPYLQKPKAGGRRRSKVTLQSIKQRKLEENDSLMAESILN